MIRRIQALNFLCLRHVDTTLNRFHVQAGPSGGTLGDPAAFYGRGAVLHDDALVGGCAVSIVARPAAGGRTLSRQRPASPDTVDQSAHDKVHGDG